jgi:hypothetical protein
MAIKLGMIARHVKIALTIAIICFGIGLVTAVPPTQPYTLYGTATLNGKVLTAQDDDVISLKVDGVELVSYTMGDIAGIDHYVLKVPIDSNSSVTTAAQEGDSAYIYINGVAISEGVQVIGAPGTTVPFDISATSASNPPSTPTLHDPGTTDTDGSYTVSWSSVSGATSYTLEEDTSSSFGSPTVVHSGAGTSKDVSGKSDGTYYYRVKACNAEGCSGWSNVEDITVEIPGSQHDLIVTGKILWNESLVANSTHAEIVSDVEGDGNPDVLVYTLRYDPVTDIGTEKVIAKKGSDGSHLWEESVTARGENNSYIIAHSAGDLDGDGLDDIIVIESEYDETADTTTAKVIAKIGKTGMPLWEESVNAAGEDNSDIFAVQTDDLDGDGLTDIIVIESIYDGATDTITARVIAKKGNTGTRIWEESVNANGKDNCNIDAKSAGDLNGDGLGDVIVIESVYDSVANATTAKVIATLGNTGTYIWEETVNANGKDNCDIDAKNAGDLDGDGFNDIIVIESTYNGATDTTTARVIAKKGNTGTRIWEESVNANGKDNCDIDAERAGDLDGDGFDDVIVSERKSNEALFTSTMSVIAKNGKTGTHMWEESVTGMVPYIYVLPAGDLDGDGLNDVIVSEIKVDELTFTATMCVIAKKGSNGASLWEESVSGTGSHIFALPAGDLDGDGLDDVIVIESKYDKTTDTTTVRIIAKNGKTGTHMWEDSVSGAGSYIAALPVGDLDGDGLNDVIATENKYDQPTDTTTTRVIAKTGKEGTHLLEAQSNELIWVATWWGHNCDLNGDGTNDLLLGISTEMYALTCLYGTNTFDTRQSADMYPSISGTHTGTITPNQDITVQKLHTYPCAGTGGHTESVSISGNRIDKSASWNGYAEDGDTITFDSSITLEAGKTYNYVIKTGSYPQIHHKKALQTETGWLNCTKFTDANGKEYDDWIPAIKLWS